MSVSSAFRELARFLEECEAGDRVSSVDLAGDVGNGGGRTLTAEVELTLSTCPSGGEDGALSLVSTRVDEEGRLGCEFRSVESVVPSTDGAVEVEPSGATLDADGTLTVSLAASVSAGDGDPAAGSASADGGRGDEKTGQEVEDAGTESGAVAAAGTDRDVPPFRDPELLAEVYESCDTFAEMTDALGMDVTAETVRRYMIDYDIHQPHSYDTDGDDDGDDTAADGEDATASAVESEPAGGSDPAEASTRGLAETADQDGKDARGGSDEPRTAADGWGSDVPVDRSGPGDGDVAVARGDRRNGTRRDGGEDDTPVVLPDGIGLPDDVTVESLVETLEQSNTVYEFKRDIGVDREDALQMLRELDLLDLLIGRIATEAERDLDREEIVRRMREASAQP